MSGQTLGLILVISLYTFIGGVILGFLALTAGGSLAGNKKTERIIGGIGFAIAVVAYILLFVLP